MKANQRAVAEDPVTRIPDKRLKNQSTLVKLRLHVSVHGARGRERE